MNFTLPTNKGGNFTLEDCKNPIVIFFYPKDDTPGCTIENQEFGKYYHTFIKNGFEVVGISRDSISSHCKFADKFALPFHLLSDTDETVCNMFGVIKDKNMYGKKVRGIERSTFILDKNKIIIKEWRKVKVDNHVNQVLEYINTLK